MNIEHNCHLSCLVFNTYRFYTNVQRDTQYERLWIVDFILQHSWDNLTGLTLKWPRMLKIYISDRDQMEPAHSCGSIGASDELGPVSWSDTERTHRITYVKRAMMAALIRPEIGTVTNQAMKMFLNRRQSTDFLERSQPTATTDPTCD